MVCAISEGYARAISSGETRGTDMQNLYHHTHPVPADTPACPACQVRAAAPVLYGALQAVEFAARIDCPRTEAWDNLLSACRAALARAEGRVSQ